MYIKETKNALNMPTGRFFRNVLSEAFLHNIIKICHSTEKNIEILIFFFLLRMFLLQRTC